MSKTYRNLIGTNQFDEKFKAAICNFYTYGFKSLKDFPQSDSAIKENWRLLSELLGDTWILQEDSDNDGAINMGFFSDLLKKHEVSNQNKKKAGEVRSEIDKQKSYFEESLKVDEATRMKMRELLKLQKKETSVEKTEGFERERGESRDGREREMGKNETGKNESTGNKNGARSAGATANNPGNIAGNHGGKSVAATGKGNGNGNGSGGSGKGGGSESGGGSGPDGGSEPSGGSEPGGGSGPDGGMGGGM